MQYRHIMYHPVSNLILVTILLAIAISSGPSAHGQDASDPASLPKNSYIWSQEQRELGFLHFDQVFDGREVPRGDHVRELPQGSPIAAFEAGGEKEGTLEDFITEQKVAGLLILQDGAIRLERYALGLSKVGRWTSHSVGKSVTSTLVGAAIKDGDIGNVDDYVTVYIPELKGSVYDSVTIRHLLTMSSGVKWSETYTGQSSDLTRYFTEPIEPGMDQTVSYMRTLQAEYAPGEKWHYNTGESNLLGVIVSTATGQTLSDYLSSKIWIPYGMEQDASWLVNRTGHELTGCCVQAALRDFGRYGQFILEGARIDGKSIVPDDWFESATKTQYHLWPGWGYGYQWWTLDDGTFRALGIHGQMIHIDPARRLVVVISSAWPEADNMGRQIAATYFLNTIASVLDEE